MAETVFEITRPLAKKNRRIVSGTKFGLSPGEKVDVPLSKVDPQLVNDVQAGEFDSDPPMSADLVDEDASVPKLVDWINSRNTRFMLKDPTVGASGVTKLNGYVEVQDAANIKNTFSDGLRVQIDVTVGAGTIDGPDDQQKILTLQNGRANFTIELAAPANEVDTVTLTDVDGTGLDVTDDTTFSFST